MNRALIWDPAHRRDTAGKRSPDGKHREYLWSRERIGKITDNINKVKHLKFDQYYPFLLDFYAPERTERVKKYNDIAKDYDQTLVISIHNDAENPKTCGSDGWGKANGAAVWTSRGQDNSDILATNWFNFMKSRYPNQKFRRAMWEGGDPDYEANFTILAGNKYIKPLYDAFLIEWLFQTNREDVEKLMNPKHNLYFEDMNTEWVLNTFNK
jgi:N-acetylmuramoyl-L-alanine amidase